MLLLFSGVKTIQDGGDRNCISFSGMDIPFFICFETLFSWLCSFFGSDAQPFIC